MAKLYFMCDFNTISMYFQEPGLSLDVYLIQEDRASKFIPILKIRFTDAK